MIELARELESSVRAAADMAIVFRRIELSPDHRSECMKAAYQAFKNLAECLMRRQFEWQAAVSGMNSEVASYLQDDIKEMINCSGQVSRKLVKLEADVSRLTLMVGAGRVGSSEAHQFDAIAAAFAEVNQLLTGPHGELMPMLPKPEAAVTSITIRRLQLPGRGATKERVAK